jgi:hypothetical protein
MGVTIEVDWTPEEVRRFLGLPDVVPQTCGDPYRVPGRVATSHEEQYRPRHHPRRKTWTQS